MGGGRNRCDIDGDWRIDIDDLDMIINCVRLGVCSNNWDLNEDGKVDSQDVQIIKNWLLNREETYCY